MLGVRLLATPTAQDECVRQTLSEQEIANAINGAYLSVGGQTP
jgi:hypothetical protein